MEILTTNRDFVAASEPRWQQHLKMAIRDVDQLLKRLDLPPWLSNLALSEGVAGEPGQRTETDLIARQAAAKSFPTFVPEPFLARMERGNPRDPLLLQVLPQAQETLNSPGYVHDPLDERSAQRAPGLLQKYAGRVLLVLTGACAVHCRYCFRREFPYESAPKSVRQWQPALDIIAADPTIHEVILSGGDPLTLVDEVLESFLAELSTIAHLRRLRIHTRLPVMIPQRVTPSLLTMLAAWQRPVSFVIHVNHAREIDGDVIQALMQLRQVPRLQLLNQSVLLRGVNDQVDTLATLSESLFAAGVLPYYLHQLDPVSGTAHFHVPTSIGLQLVDKLRQLLPGYLVPRYVQELPHEPYKTLVTA